MFYFSIFLKNYFYFSSFLLLFSLYIFPYNWGLLKFASAAGEPWTQFIIDEDEVKIKVMPS